MTRWYTSDLHLGHAAMLRADYCGRPWATVDDMNAGLLARWNEVIRPGDEVYVIGDLTLKNPAPNGTPAPWLADWLSRAYGDKCLIIGNYDSKAWHATRRAVALDNRGDGSGWAKIAEWERLYEQLGFSDMLLDYSVEIDAETVFLSHLPWTRTGHENIADSDYVDSVPLPGQEVWRLHGHVHDAWQQNGREINVGVDAWNGYPVPESTIAALIAAGPQARPPYSWEAA